MPVQLHLYVSVNHLIIIQSLLLDVNTRYSGAVYMDPTPNVASGNAVIVQGSFFRCGFAIEVIAQTIDD
jgi:hypothetical protein